MVQNLGHNHLKKCKISCLGGLLKEKQGSTSDFFSNFQKPYGPPCPIVQWATCCKIINCLKIVIFHPFCIDQQWMRMRNGCLFLPKKFQKKGREDAKITVCVQTCWPSSQDRVTSVMSLNSLKFPKAPLKSLHWRQHSFSDIFGQMLFNGNVNEIFIPIFANMRIIRMIRIFPHLHGHPYTEYL